MNTVSASSHRSNSVTPVIRHFPFDPLRHAPQFLESQLVLTTSKTRGNPQLLFAGETSDGYVEAGSITHVPEKPASMAGPALPASIAISGRMAEYTDSQRQVLMDAGVHFIPKPGHKKTFYTAYITWDKLELSITAFEHLKTNTGKDCLLGHFTARGILLFKRRMKDLEE